MPLPQNNAPQYELTMPTTKQKIKYRPFLVGEQKVVLMAKEAGSDSIMMALRQIVDRCTFGKLDVDSMPDFDVEWLFLQTRIRSSGANVELVVTCQHCGENHDYMLDLNQVKMDVDPAHSKKIMLAPDLGVEMDYPSTEQLEKLRDEFTHETMYETVKQCIKTVFTADEVFPTKDETDEEMVRWLDGLTDEQFSLIENFFATMPAVRHEFIETCPHCEKQTKFMLEGVESFFA